MNSKSLEEKIRKRREDANNLKNSSSEEVITSVIKANDVITPTEILLQQTPGHKQDDNSIVIPVASIEIPESQSRTPDNPGCSPESLQLLADDIREHEQDTPIVVIAMDAGGYRLHSGWRRLTAKHRLIKQYPTEMPHRTIRATLKSFDDEAHEFFRHAAENLQRENLTPLEEAATYRRIKNDFNLTDELLSLKVKKSRAHVSRMLQLLKLPDDVQSLVRHGVVGYRSALKSKDKVVAEYIDTLPVVAQERVKEGDLTLEAVLSDPSVIEGLKSGVEKELSAGDADELNNSGSLTETTNIPPVEKKRLPKVAIPLEAATAMCDLLKLLCEQYNMAHIELTKKKGKYVRKDLLAVLEARTNDVLRAAKNDIKS